MIKEATGTGATVDEAREKAIAALGAGAEDDIQFDVEPPKKKILGLFGGSPAKVRVWIEVPDEKKPTSKKQNHEKKEQGKKQNKPA